MGQATYVGKVLGLDQPWESSYQLEYPGSVVTDPATGQLRMYYEMCVSGQEFQRGVAMATSTDGIHWTKPALNCHGHDLQQLAAEQLRQSSADLDGRAQRVCRPQRARQPALSHVGHGE